MEKKQSLILIFVVIIFGSQIACMTWTIVQGMFGLFITSIILKLLSPDIYDEIARYVPLLEIFSWKSLFKYFGSGYDKVTDKICKREPLNDK